MAKFTPEEYPRISGSLLDLYQEFMEFKEEDDEDEDDEDDDEDEEEDADEVEDIEDIENSEAPETFSNSNDILNIDESATKVMVKITSSDVEGLLPELEKLGFEVLGSAPSLYFIEGWMPIEEMLQLASLDELGLMGVLPVYPPVTSAGSTTSQADFVQETERVRESLPTGFDGSGVTIGVMSDSYDVSGNGSAAADIASGDLPSGINVLQEGPSGSSDEGRAMLQLVHDLAPGSDLAFSSVVSGELDFAQQIRDLADPTLGNAEVLVDDITYFSEPFFQDGVIAQAVDDVVTNDGVTYFASAGNRARSAYESTSFNAVADSALDIILSSPVGSSYHDFDSGAGVDTRQQITLNNGQSFTPAFQWDDPFYTAGDVETNLDIFLIDSSNTVVASSIDNNIFNQTPFETFDFTNTNGSQQDYDVVIRLTDGPAPGRIKYVNFGTRGFPSEYPLDAPTVNPHAAAENGRAVAAIGYFEQTTPEAFTSEGPTTILFEPDGTPKATPEVRQTPDFAAIDGTDTTFFGSSDFDSTGFPNFFGTSAAAPHAAAIAALINQANPTFTPADIYNALETTAIDIGAAGFDNVTGFGLINAYDAVFGDVVPASLNFTDDFEDGDLPIAYETNTNGAGRIQVTTENNPIGTQHLTLDAAFGRFSLNEVILHVDTTGLDNVQLSFDHREFGDFDDPMPATFTGSDDSDGVALSVDGTNWIRLISLTGSNSTETYQTRNFDLSSIAASNGLTLGSDVQIKFQQFGNSAINSSTSPSSSGGFAFDNISVTGSNTLNGTPARETLTGTTANDVITGLQGGDTLTGGAGNDEFVYTTFRDAGDRITDFTNNVDKIDLDQLFDSLSLGSLDYSSATSGGYLTFVDSGADSVIFIDSDGSSGAGRATPFILVENIASATLNNANNFVI